MKKYTEEHLWVEINDDIAIVGISEYAAKQLGDLAFIDLPEVGAKFEKGSEAAIAESVKTASEIFSPLAGEVIAINKMILNDPILVNEDPTGSGWFFKLKMRNPADTDVFMDKSAYEKIISK